MKKLIALTAFCMPAVLLLIQCSGPSDKYTVKGRIEAGETPLMAYIEYAGKEGMTTDSAEVVKGRFQFKGTAAEPVAATIYLSEIPRPAGAVWGIKDSRKFYIEPGTVNITAPGRQIKNAEVSGTPVNDDAKKWQAVFGPVLNAYNTAMSWWNELSVQEKRDPANKAKYDSGIAEYQSKRKAMSVDFIKANPDSYFALAELFLTTAKGMEPADAEALFNTFTERVRNTGLGIRYKENVDSWTRTAIGAVAPDFSLPDRHGKMLPLSSLRGKYVLVDFWASWCAPCRVENPNLKKAYDALKDKGLEILSVSTDANDTKGKVDWKQAIEADGTGQWLHVLNNAGKDNEVVKIYGVGSIPMNFLLDPEGRIIARNIRGESTTELLKKHMGLE